MRAEYINPFLSALTETFATMLNCQAKRLAVKLKDTDSLPHEVSGMIGLSGKAVGMVVLSFSETFARQASGVLLMAEPGDVSDTEMVDAVGELTNMVAGAAKARLEEFSLSMSLPTVVRGSDHAVHFPSSVQPLTVPYETPWGPLALEVGLVTTAEPALVAQ